MNKPRVKICCISSVAESQTAIKHGASALGLVGNMPSGPGIITDTLINQIAMSAPPPVSTFLLTSQTDSLNIIAHYKKVNTSVIQIVDIINYNQYELLRQQLPHVKIVQVVHVINQKSVDYAIEVAQFVDAILLDSGNPNLNVKQLGGTGRVHNWQLSRQIVNSLNIPVFLAGGLNSNNVKQAIDYVMPFGIDVCSGVRTNGKLDENKLDLFFKAIDY